MTEGKKAEFEIAEAEFEIVWQWLALPAPQRRTEDQAVVFMKAAARSDFPYRGDRYQVIKSWLRKYIGWS